MSVWFSERKIVCNILNAFFLNYEILAVVPLSGFSSPLMLWNIVPFIFDCRIEYESTKKKKKKKKAQVDKMFTF